MRMKISKIVIHAIILLLLTFGVGCTDNKSSSLNVEEFYESLEVGMPIDDVIAKVGDPVSKMDVGGGHLQYSFILKDIRSSSDGTVGFVALVRDGTIVKLSKSYLK
jgi:hypothetical protein